MSIYSTVDLTREQVIDEINKRVRELESMSDSRLIDTLESLCQWSDQYDDSERREDEFMFNNFSIIL